MTFEWPELLWLILLAPVALALQLWSERRRRRQAAAFTNPALLPNVVTARPGWRAWLPVAFYLLAASVLLVALARPEAVARVPRDEATVMLVVDASASMLADDVSPSRVAAARQAVGQLLDQLPERFQVGLVTFSASAHVESRPTRDRAALREALAKFRMRPGTAMGDGLRLALAMSRTVAPGNPADPGNPDARPPTTVLLLGDGLNTNGVPPLLAAEEARREGVQVFTVALGTPAATMQQSDGRFVSVAPDQMTLQGRGRTHRRTLLHRADQRRPRQRLPGARLARHLRAGGAGGDRHLPGRGGGPAPGRRRRVAPALPPPAVTRPGQRATPSRTRTGSSKSSRGWRPAR